MKRKKKTKAAKVEAAKQDGTYCVVRDERIPYGLCSKLRKRPDAHCGLKGCERAKEKKHE